MEDNSEKTGHVYITLNLPEMTEEEQEAFLKEFFNLAGIPELEIKKMRYSSKNAGEMDHSGGGPASNPSGHDFK